MYGEKMFKTVEAKINQISKQFGFEIFDGHLDLRNYTNPEVFNFFDALAQTGEVVFHGTNAEERFDALEARQANDSAKESGNKKAVYADTDAKPSLFLAVVNKNYLRSKFSGFASGWSDDGKMIFKLSPNVYELLKSGDPNLFNDGYIYVLDKDNFINAEDAGHEWHSEIDQKPLLACRVSKKLADDILIFGKGDADNVLEYSSEEMANMNKLNNVNQ